MSLIAQPIALGPLTAPNRILKSAMTERLCHWDPLPSKRGKISPEYVEAYKVWAEGGTGIIVLGNIPIDSQHLEAKGNAIIDRNSEWDPVASFAPAIAAAKSHGAIVIGQLTHGGRQVPKDVNEHTLSASNIRTPDFGGMEFTTPDPMTLDQIRDVVARFGYGAKVLYEAGANGAQAHAAHGYLISQFLSPKTNKRADQYGGSFENRSRLLVEILQEMRKQVPDEKFILSIKYNSQDFNEEGFPAEDSRQLALVAEKNGVVLIELSGGTYESMAFEHKSEHTKAREAYFLDFADKIRPMLTTAALAVTGGFRNPEAMDKAIKDKSCQIIGLARPLCAEPNLPKKMFAGKGGAIANLVPGALTTPAAIAQIHNFANKQLVADLSDQKIADEVVAKITGQKKEEPTQTYPSKE